MFYLFIFLFDFCVQNAELRNYFQIRVQNLTHSLGKTAIFWQEVFDINTTLVHNSIVNAWYSNVVKEVVRKGHR